MTMGKKTFILQNTKVVSPRLCPEIRLHLITESCPLWRATEAELAALALDDPYWGFCWGGGEALARFVLDQPGWVEGRRVLDFGAGCGIGAIAAGKAGAAAVSAADVDPLAGTAVRLNALANEVAVTPLTADLIGDPLLEFDVVLAGDMFYDPLFARRVLSWLTERAAAGMEVVIADPGRGNLAEAGLTPLAAYWTSADVDISGKYLQKTRVYQLHATRPSPQ